MRLTGFGIASRLPREHPAPEPPEVIAGTLAYMAPEQTGRMNRSVDARSDLYALGVTLYQMLTGELPFTAPDLIELVHCHIARRPVPPAERTPGLPLAISAIVMKLLAKTPEDRYQTAAGVAADLRHCLTAWETNGGSVEPFLLGVPDVPDVLRIPEKLYGREQEVRALLAAFERVVALNVLDAVASPPQVVAVADGLCAPGGEIILASPYAWQAGIVADEHRFGGDDPAGALRRRLVEGDALEARYTIEDEAELPWTLRRDARSAVVYSVHWLRARKAR